MPVTARLRSGEWGFVLVVLCLLFAAYWPALSGNFLMSDVRVIAANPRLLSLDGLVSIWWPVPSDRYPPLDQYQPLTYTLFWIERQLFGLEPRAYQVVGLLLHAVSTVLVGRLLARVGVRGAPVAAVLFALHPVQVESVAWIYEQKNLLSGVFFFASLLAYLSFEEEGGRARYRAALGLFVLALLAKPTTVALPVLLVLYRWFRRLPLRPADLAPIVPFFAAALAMSGLTLWHEGAVTGASGGLYAADPIERLVRSGQVVGFHAAKLLVPIDLAFFYPRFEVDVRDPLAWAPGVGIAALLAAAWWRREGGGRPALLGLGWYLALMFPVAGLFDIYYHQHSFVADHFQYLPAVGLIALVVHAVASGVERLGGSARTDGAPRSELAAVVAASAVLLSLFLTWQRAHVFANDLYLARDAAGKYPDAELAFLKVGEFLLQYAAATPGADHGEALAQAVEALEHAVSLRPAHPQFRDTLGAAYFMTGRLDEARPHMEFAVGADPDNPAFRRNLAVLLERQGEGELAAMEYRAMVAADPDSLHGRLRLARALLAVGRDAAARDELDEIRARADALPPDARPDRLLAGADRLSRQAEARLSEAAAPAGAERPRVWPPRSVLLLTIDTLRPDYLGVNGFPLPTSPALDALVREGVYFEQALTPVPRTTPALASLLTGAYPHGTGVRALADSLPPEVVTLAEALQPAGYRTAAVVTNLLLAADPSLGAGFEVYDAAFDVRDARRTTDAALARLRALGRDGPVLLWVHYIDPHVPYDPDDAIAEAFDPDYSGRFQHGFGRQPGRGEAADLFREFPEGLKKSAVTHRNPLSPEENEHIRKLYGGDIRMLDDQVGRVVDAFRARFPEAVIVLAADHGESLGEHDFYFDHGDYVYNAASRVPLAFVLPADHPWHAVGRRSGWVSLVDVAPTLLDVLGIEPPADMRALFEGRSLAPALRGEPLEERPVFIESGTSFFPDLVRRRQSNDVAGRFRAVTRGGWKLIWTPQLPDDEAFELYDLASDPHETRNLYTPDHPRVAALRSDLDAWLARDPAVGAPSAPLSDDAREALRALGYIE